MSKRYLTSKHITDMVASLCTSIELAGWEPEIIVGIGRGGLVPAVMISHYFDVPMQAVQWSTRDHPSTESNCWLAEDAGAGKHTLIVDDILDTGESMSQIIDDWDSLICDDIEWGKTAKIAVLQQKPTASVKADFYAELLEKDEWQVYPWENWFENIKSE